MFLILFLFATFYCRCFCMAGTLATMFPLISLLRWGSDALFDPFAFQHWRPSMSAGLAHGRFCVALLCV